MNDELKSCKRILVYRLGSLGDTIMVLPCFHKVKEVFSHSDITLLTNLPVAAKAAPVVSVIGIDFFNRQITYPIGTRNPFTLLKLLWKIRRLKIQMLINLTASRSMYAAKRDKWFFRLAGIKHFVGFPENEKDFKVTVDKTTGELEWEALRLARRIKPIGNINFQEDRYWDLLISASEQKKAVEVIGSFTNASIIAISMGTKIPSNDWGEDNWTGLISALKYSLKDYVLVIIGAPADKMTGGKICKSWGVNSINACGLLSPRESAALLKHAKLFIGHDSGPIHLAAAMGIRCVGIFSARHHPRQWYPRGNNNSVIYHKTECAGCNLEICVAEKKKCIFSITIQEVFDTVINKLQEN
jgi:heptosyltransferase III